MRRLRQSTLWQLPRAARPVVVGVDATYAAALIATWFVTPLGLSAVLTSLAFTGAAVSSAELSMRLAWPRTRRDRISRDLLSIWIIPIALLLPPAYVAAVILLARAYVHLRIARVQPVKFLYSTAALGIAYVAASASTRLVLGVHPTAVLTAHELQHGWRTAAALLVAVLTWWAVNHALILGVVWLTTGSSSVHSFFRDREGFVVDAVTACIAILATLLWASNPVTELLLVPPVLLLQHQLFSGLRKAVRTDLLTDVANPQFWREVAGREIERARASSAHLAVLMIDVDHFKSVNDRHGHLAGDEVLATVARTITKALRPGDLVGRLGGEEFGALLTGLNLLDAEGAAERVRSQAAGVRVRSDRGEWVGVTVSVGVAELTVSGPSLHDLLSAADQAMYAAKAAGRNKVRAAGPRAGQIIDLSAVERRANVDLDAGTAPSTP